MARAFVKTFGCQMNLHDSQRIRDALQNAGVTLVSSPQEAEVVVVNTCNVREKAANRARGYIESFAKRARVLATGCLATVEPDRLVDCGAEAAFGVSEEVEIAPYVGGAPVGPPTAPGRRPFSFLRVMTGCDARCSYCAVPSSRGPETSAPFDECLARFDELDETGSVEVTLLGQRVNAYRWGGKDFADLLLALAERARSVKWLRFLSPHPTDFTERLVEVVSSTPLVPKALHLPLQSGSDGVLEAMGRLYTRDGYLSLAADLAERGVALTTDVIVGYPGETDEDFARTLDVVRRVRFHNAFTFVYSPRSGTPAADAPDEVPPAVARARLDALNALVADCALSRRREMVGKAVEVLVDNRRASAAKRCISTGHAENNVSCVLSSPHAPGEMVRGRVTSLRNTTPVVAETRA